MSESLLKRDYYGAEANRLYMSVSQYKDFCKCEACAVAKLRGDYAKEGVKAFIFGNYVHSYFESEEAHEQFKEEHKSELFSSRKPYGLLKDYQVAQKIIEHVREESLFKYLWNGEREETISGELFGVDWKGKIDLLNVEKGYFVDLKTVAQLDKRFWSDTYGRYVSFVEHYGYVLQIAVYEKLLELKYGKSFTGYIYAVTKNEIPDVAAIEIAEEYKLLELERLEQNIERVTQVKNGEVEPVSCGVCEYCKSRKTLKKFVTTDELIARES